MLTKQTMKDMLVNRVEYLHGIAKMIKETDSKEEKKFNLLIDKLITASENFACHVREFCICIGIRTREEVLEKAAKIQNINITKEDNVLKIELPFILPRKKNQKNKHLTETLAYELSNASKTLELKMKQKAVIVFVHIYDETLSSARCYDYDNLESKNILDVISSFTLQDDGPEYCSVYHKTERGNKNKTVIYVLNEEEFFSNFRP